MLAPDGVAPQAMTSRVFLAVCFSASAAAFGYGALAPVLPSVLEHTLRASGAGAAAWHAGAIGGYALLGTQSFGLIAFVVGVGAVLGARSCSSWPFRGHGDSFPKI